MEEDVCDEPLEELLPPPLRLPLPLTLVDLKRASARKGAGMTNTTSCKRLTRGRLTVTVKSYKKVLGGGGLGVINVGGGRWG